MKEKITEELNKISNMDKAQKWDYFKTYYLVKTIALVIGLVLLVWFIKDTFLQKKIVNAGCVYGVEISEEERIALTEGYLKYYDINPKKYASYVSTDNMFEGTEQQMDANAHEMALIAQATAGEVFYLILDRENLEMMENSGIILSLDEAFIGEVPKVELDSLVSLKNPETNESYNAAIDLKKAGILKDGREGYLVFTIGIPDSGYPKRFLDYLINI